MRDPRSAERFKNFSSDFTRTSPLSFPVVVSSILHLFKESVEFNIHSALPCLKASPVSGSAFTQARYKINYTVFEELCQLVNDSFKSSSKKLWKGYQLIAGDGSTLNLPPSKSIENFFGVHSVNEVGIKRYLARVFFIYDSLNDFVVSGRISKMTSGEKTMLLQCLGEINPEGSILTLDRGFGHFCTIKDLLLDRRLICVRLPIDNSLFARRILKEESADFITEWTPSPKEKENCRKNNLDYRPFKIRAVKVVLKTGETEILITNLFDQDKFSYEDINELYQFRWGVEEGFKKLKPKMKIEHFGCRKAEGIFQEFYAHIFCMNMVALAGAAANEVIEKRTKKRKWKYKYNWQNAYRFVREKIVQFANVRNVTKLVEELINQISASVIAIKPDRSFVRDLRHKNKKGRITQFHK